MIGDYYRQVPEFYTIAGEGDLEKLRAAETMIAETLLPMEIGTIAELLTELHMKVAVRNKGSVDMEATFFVYAEDLAEYPADVVADVIADWGRNEKWWPTVSELRSQAYSLAYRRRAMLRAVQKQRQSQHGQTS